MKTFAEYLEESIKNSLFYGRSISSSELILKHNMLEARTPLPGNLLGHEGDKEVMGVSLSRSVKTARDFGAVIFELDKEKLQQNYKLTPVQFFNIHGDMKSARTQIGNKPGRSTEFEEFVYGSIKNLDKYIIRIWITKELFNDLPDESLIYNHPKTTLTFGPKADYLRKKK